MDFILTLSPNPSRLYSVAERLFGVYTSTRFINMKSIPIIAQLMITLRRYGAPMFASFNPNKTYVPFVGHWQTVQIQIRCHIMRHLIRAFTVSLQDFQLQTEQKRKKKKYTPDTPYMTNGFTECIRMENPLGLLWTGWPSD